MAPEVVCIVGVVVLLVALFLLKRISSVVKSVLALVAIVVGFAGYVIFVPSSSVSIWVTENVASVVKLDNENRYEPGDVLFTYEFNPTAEDNADEATSESDLLTSGLQNVAGSMNKLLADRIEAIASKYIELQEEYTLSFSDSYLLMTPGELSMKIEIVKGALPED